MDGPLTMISELLIAAGFAYLLMAANGSTRPKILHRHPGMDHKMDLNCPCEILRSFTKMPDYVMLRNIQISSNHLNYTGQNGVKRILNIGAI